jgi:hypothetical protein
VKLRLKETFRFNLPLCQLCGQKRIYEFQNKKQLETKSSIAPCMLDLNLQVPIKLHMHPLVSFYSNSYTLIPASNH